MPNRSSPNLWRLTAFALAAVATVCFAQSTVLLKEAVSREFTLHVGGVSAPVAKEVVSREVSFQNGSPADLLSPEVVSREFELVVKTTDPPERITQLVVDMSPDASQAVLSWVGYEEFPQHDVAEYRVYVEDTFFTDVTSLTPYLVFPPGTLSVTLTGLIAWRDHYFAVVPVDLDGALDPVVDYAAGYVQGAELITREFSLHNGGIADPMVQQLVSRELHLAVATTALPARITQLVVSSTPTGEEVTLSWVAYNEIEQQDVQEYRVFLADEPFTDVTGLTPYAVLPPGTKTLVVSGLTAWQDKYFAVVAVDLLGGYDPIVDYAANYVLSREVVTREFSLHTGGVSDPVMKDLVSREVDLVVADDVVPEPVTGVGSGFKADTSASAYKAVDLIWPNYDELAQRDVVAYRIYVGLEYFGDVSGMTPYETIAAGRSGCTVGGLESNSIYHFAVVAEDANGGFDPTVHSAVALSSPGGVSAVQNLEVESGATSLTYTWNQPAEGVAFLDHYEAFVGDATDPVVLAKGSESYAATGLEAAHGYYFRIVAVDVFGNDAGTSSVFGATWLPNPTPAKKELDGAVRLTWNAVEPVALLEEYAVYQSDADFTDVGAMTPIATTGDTRFMVTGLTNGGTYYFAVVAVNTSSGFSPTVAAIEVVPEPDLQGAKVIAAAPSGPSAVGPNVEQILQRFTVTFDDVMTGGSFTVDDVTVLAPARATVGVLGVVPLSETEFEVTLADAVAGGTYTVTVGPDIRDEADNQMDQDGNGTNGEVTDAYSFDIVLTDPGLPVGTGDGLLGEYFSTEYKSGTGWRQRDGVVDFDWADGTPVTDAPADHFSVVWTGELEVRFAADYAFRLQVDNGARLWLDGVLVIDDWYASRAESVSAPIALAKGRQAVRLEYVERTGSAAIAWEWSCPFFANQTVPQSQLYSGLAHTEFAATPNVAPDGGTVTADTDITLACATAGAAVYYSLANPDPDVPGDWTLYEGTPIHLTSSGTLRSFATKDDYNRSGVRVASFDLQKTELSGRVWADADGNGVQDGGEQGIADRLLFLDANGDSLWTAGEVSGRTGADGSYTLRTPFGGTHRLRIALGGDDRLSVPAAAGLPGYDVSTVAGQQVGDLDFGVLDGVPPVVGFDKVVANGLPALFTGTIDDPTASVLVSLAGTALAGTNNGDGTWQVDTAGFGAVADGCHDVVLTGTDASGNQQVVTVVQAVCLSSAPLAVQSVSPVLVEGRALARVEVTFSGEVAPDSLQVEDFTLASPVVRDTVAASLVRLEGQGTVAVAEFPAQTANGSYLLEVGPAISSVFGNPMAEAYQQTIVLKLPDLLAKEVVASPTSLAAGETVTVSWKEQNVGTLAATGGWRTSFRLVAIVRAGDTELDLGSVASVGDLAAGEETAREETLQLPDWIPAGTALRIRVDVNPQQDPLEAGWGNNAAESQSLDSPAVLSIHMVASSVAENAGSLTGEVRRNGDTSSALTVSLVVDPDTGASVPATVEIPAGSSSVGFALTVVDDALVTGDRQVVLSATATGLASGEATVTIQENDRVALGLAAVNSTNVLESEELQLRLSRDDAAGLGGALSVSLSLSVTNQVLVPATVVIPAGETETTFLVQTINDDEYEQVGAVIVTASASNCQDADLRIDVFDDDEPTLMVRLDRESCSEADGAQAIAGVVSRGERAGADLLVRLEVDDPGSLLVPSQVVIPAGLEEVAFDIGAVDNAVLDGDRDVLLTVSGLMSDCGCTATSRRSRAVSIVEKTIAVRDDDAPGLRLTVDRTVAQEGVADAFTFTLTRNTATDAELVVSLSAAPADELSVPPTATLAVGESSVTFTADSVDDGLQDGTKTVLVRAEADGLSPAEIVVNVTDLQLPDLVISAVSSDLQVVSGTTFVMRYTMVNQGQGTAEEREGLETEGWVQRVYLSADPFIGDDELIGNYRFNGPQPAGEQWAVSQTVSAYAPPVNGEYWVVVVADINGDVDEILETNNARISAVPLVVSASYEATVQTDFETGVAALTLADATPIVLYGSAAYLSDGSPAASVPVHVHIKVRDYERTLLAITDLNGQYTCTFRPLPGEGGEYTVGACHPGDSEAPEQDSFTIIGMRAEPPKGEVTVPVGQTVQADFTIHNLSEVPLDGLVASVVDAPTYLHVTPQLGTTSLGALGSVALGCEFQADDPGAVQEFEIVLRVEANGGAAVEIPVSVTVRPLKAVLAVTSGDVYAGMKRGGQTLVQVMVQNQGAVGSGAIAVELPSASWLGLATDNPMPGIEPGESAPLVLSLTPAADASLARYEGRLVLRQEHGDDLTVPFEFRVVSDAVGDLAVTTVNQFYYYAAGAPTLAGATVQVLDGFTGDLVAEGVSDADGVALFPALAEGYYTVLCMAEKHRESREVVFVAAGTSTEHLAYLVRKTVEVTWTVEEVELEDRVKVNIETTFETNVPAPVVTVDPAVIDLGDLKTVGQVERITMTIANHGLISAANMRLNVGTHPYYSIEPLVTEFGDLPAMGSISVPVVLRRIGDETTVRSQRSAPCGVAVSVDFEMCRRVEVVPVGTSNSAGDCGGSGGGGGPGGGGGSASVSGGVGGSADRICACLIDADCPCVLPYLNAGLTCFINFIPGFDLPKCLYGAYGCGGDILKLNANVTSVSGCLGAALDCASAAGKSVPGLGQIIGGINCISSIYDAIKECEARGAAIVLPVSVQGAYRDLLALMSGAEPHYRYFLELYGDAKWLDYTLEARRDWEDGFRAAIAEDSPGGFRITADEQATLLAQSAGPAISQGDKQALVDRYNNTEAYLRNGWTSAADVPEGMSLNFIDVEALMAWSLRMNQVRELALSQGYDGYLTGIQYRWKGLNSVLNGTTHVAASSRARAGIDTSGQCAKVKLLLSQDVVLAHEGFEATLKVENGEEIELTDLAAEVRIFAADGSEADGLMAVGTPALTQFTALDGSGVLQVGKTGTASWLIVPRAEAAPVAATNYYVGGVFTYAINGTKVTIPLASVEITVHPQPELHLEYYHQRDVFSDDPWTEEIEPSIPYELAVLVRNTGAGVARNLHIVSGQPQIVENEKGLLIDFQLVGHEVDGQSLTPSLTAVFGDVGAGGSSVARWWMTSTLQGQFTEYSATLSHTSPLGDPRLSQIKDVAIFELIRSVEVDGASAFLTNDTPDAEDLPDTIHQRDGSVLPVSPSADEDATVTGVLAPDQLQATLTVVGGAGWNYLRLTDRDPGGDEYVLVDVRDESDASLPADNFWQTDRTFVMGGVRPRLENNLHLLFVGDGARATRTFTLHYRSADQVGPVVRSLALPPSAEIGEAQDAFLLEATESLALGSLSKADFELWKDDVGTAVPDLTPTAASATSVRVAGFTAATSAPGDYRLTVSGAGLTDVFGNAGFGTATVEWTVAPDGPVPVGLSIVGRERQNFPVDACEVTFSQAVDLGTVDDGDVRLFRDGTEIPVAGLGFTGTGLDSLRIFGLQTLAAVEGTYRLVFDAAGIAGPGGGVGAGTKSVEWVFDQTPPEATAILPVERGLVDTSVRSQTGMEYVRIAFSEPLGAGTFTLDDLDLSRNGTPIGFGAGVTLTTSDRQEFRLGGIYDLTAPEGTYVLTVDQSGVLDEAGNAGSGEATEAWVCDHSPPLPPSDLSISPDTGELDDDGVTTATSVTLRGSLSEPGLAVEVTGIGSTPLAAAVAGTEFSLELAGLAGGTYPLTITARDVAENEAEAEWTIFVDEVDLNADLSLISSVRSSVAGVLVEFSAPVAADTFTAVDLALLQDGQPLALDGNVVLTPRAGSETAYEITGLPVPIDAGLCELRLDLAGVDKRSSGRNGGQVARISWQNQGALQDLDISPRSALSPDTVITASRTPSLVGTTPVDWLTVVVEDDVEDELARTEVDDGAIELPLELFRDGVHSITVRGTDASGNETSQQLDFIVDTRAPQVIATEVERNANGELYALRIRFSEDMNIQARIDDGTISDLVGLEYGVVRQRRALALPANELAWDSTDFVLSWLPADPTALSPSTYRVTYVTAGLTDYAERSLVAPATSFSFVVARARVTDGTPTVLDALGPSDLTYRWDFGDGSATEDGQAVTHQFAENGDFEIWMTVLDGNGELFRYVTTLLRGTGNQAPALDLDLLTAGNDALARICPEEQEAPLVRLSRVLLADGDDRTLASLAIQLSAPVQGEDEALVPPVDLPAGVSASYSVAEATLTFSGPASPDAFREALAGARYQNATEVPVPDDRVLHVVVDDGDAQVQRTVTLRTRDRLRLQVAPGWGLYSVPFTPEQPDTATVFADDQRALLVRNPVFAWNPPLLRYSAVAATQGQVGMWALSNVATGTETRESSGFCQRNEPDLLEGWNLWGPAEDVSVTELLLERPEIQVVWRWDVTLGNYVEMVGDDTLQRGFAYWLYLGTE